MLVPFLSGVVVAGFLVAGLFFLRFWRRSGDGLFAAFAVSFWLLGLNQALLTFSTASAEERSWLFLLRLLAFGLILVAIGLKNRRR